MMPKKIVKESWICSYTKQTFETEAEALESEMSFLLSEMETKVKTFLPVRHAKDTQYCKYCVSCGSLLREYERVWDGIDKPYAGKILYEKESFLDFNGKRCIHCHVKLCNLLIECLEKASHSESLGKIHTHETNKVKKCQKKSEELIYWADPELVKQLLLPGFSNL